MFFNEIFIKVPRFNETSPSLKNFWLGAWVGLFDVCTDCENGRLFESEIQDIFSDLDSGSDSNGGHDAEAKF